MIALRITHIVKFHLFSFVVKFHLIYFWNLVRPVHIRICIFTINWLLCRIILRGDNSLACFISRNLPHGLFPSQLLKFLNLLRLQVTFFFQILQFRYFFDHLNLCGLLILLTIILLCWWFPLLQVFVIPFCKSVILYNIAGANLRKIFLLRSSVILNVLEYRGFLFHGVLS